MENEYFKIKKIVDTLKTKTEDIKIVFKSNKSFDDVSFASYQFPSKKFDENTFETLKKYAEVDYEINKRNYNEVGTTTKFKFYDADSNICMATYEYKHSLEFLDSMNGGLKM